MTIEEIEQKRKQAEIDIRNRIEQLQSEINTKAKLEIDVIPLERYDVSDETEESYDVAIQVIL